ncbi:Gfo/Idh/MocA family protein [Paenibacillus massiliensis]|uniref:Gfo/Idh/MocA family protein n=1 Tax=Paenibacillus massiliensis TaxID=225917 RepID=UPI00037EA648|nr:Gfo/Idh/MocA family oxidoreductase [Paenibacillus massiliensis]
MGKMKWGIMGAGEISRSFASDLLQSAEGELLAVASRTPGKAKGFAEEFKVSKTYDNYEQFVADPEIEIVYVGTLHPMHKEGVLMCLNAGKAVICEKPFMMNAQETEEVIQAAKKNNVFVMEAMWTRYLPPIVQAREWIKEGRIGDVKMLTANFGFNFGWDPGHRLLDKKLGGGALLDAGIYPVSFASMVFGRQPSRINSNAYIGETGVDERFSALFEYEGGQTALLSAGVQLGTSNDAFIYGTKGYIQLTSFLFGKAATLHLPNEEPVHFEKKLSTHGYIFEAEEAMRCVREGLKESSIMPINETLEIMQTLDRLRGQWGLVYESEELNG